MLARRTVSLRWPTASRVVSTRICAPLIQTFVVDSYISATGVNGLTLRDESVAAVRWGILSTAKIARTKFIPGVRAADNCEVVAIASRNPTLATAVAGDLGIPVAHGSYEALLADPD